MGSLRVEETSAYCTVNHRASASNYQLSNIKRPARHSNRQPQRLEARTLTATPPSAPTCRVSKSRDLWVQGRDLTDEPDFSQLVITTVIIYPVNVMVPKYLKPDTDFSHKWDKFKWFLHLCQHFARNPRYKSVYVKFPSIPQTYFFNLQKFTVLILPS